MRADSSRAQITSCSSAGALDCGSASVTGSSIPRDRTTVWMPDHSRTTSVAGLAPGRPYAVFSTAWDARCGSPNRMAGLCPPVVCTTVDPVCAVPQQVCECTNSTSTQFRLSATKLVKPKTMLVYNIQYQVLEAETPDGLEAPGEPRTQKHRHSLLPQRPAIHMAPAAEPSMADFDAGAAPLPTLVRSGSACVVDGNYKPSTSVMLSGLRPGTRYKMCAMPPGEGDSNCGVACTPFTTTGSAPPRPPCELSGRCSCDTARKTCTTELTCTVDRPSTVTYQVRS